MHIHTSIYTHIFHSIWTPQTSTLFVYIPGIPTSGQRWANVSLLLDNDGHPRKSIYLKVFFSPCVVNFIDFNALIHTLIALHVGPM